MWVYCLSKHLFAGFQNERCYAFEMNTVLPAKSDSDFMFCLQIYQRLIIDGSLVYLSYPQDRINTQVIYRFGLAEVKCTR